MRHHSKILEDCLNEINAGEIEVVCNETKRIQRILASRSKPSKGTKQKNKNAGTDWISDARRHVTTCEIRRAKRCIEENEQGIETTSNETFNKLAAMFTPRKNQHISLPPPEPCATQYAHETHCKSGKARWKCKQVEEYRTWMPKLTQKFYLARPAYLFQRQCARRSQKYATLWPQKRLLRILAAPMQAVRIIAHSRTVGGIRPIEIGDIMRREITKTLAKVIKDDVKIATGAIQCAGLPGACESAIKATELAYQGRKSILILDAKSTFNCLSRSETLFSTCRSLPHTYQLFRNFYNSRSNTFYNGKSIKIQEGTIPGCGLCNIFYGVGIKTVAETMRGYEIAQIWVCDELSAGGRPGNLKEWFQKLKDRITEYGQITNPGCCHMVSKGPNVPRIFKEEIQRGKLRVSEGPRYPGARIGTDAFKRRFFKENVTEHIKKLKRRS